MSPSIDHFWHLACESSLLSKEQCRSLARRFRDLRGATKQANSRALATWLVSEGVITEYQAHVLLRGKPGPFDFGEYRIGDRLGSPPGAKRFSALHRPTNHQVLLHFFTGDPVDWASTRRLINRHIGVADPHLDRCFQACETLHHRLAVSEDVEGSTLTQLISAASISQQAAIQTAAAIARGLSQLHAAGLVHGFVTPDDIVMRPTGEPKLRRFPLTPIQPLNFDQPYPHGQLLTLADYLAPELRRHDRAPDARSDIYALGCVLFQALSGRPPFGGDLAQKMHRHATERIQSLSERGVGQELEEVVAFMMAKNPEVRFQNAVDVAEKLETFIVGGPKGKRSAGTQPSELQFLDHLERQGRLVPEASRSNLPPPTPPTTEDAALARVARIEPIPPSHVDQDAVPKTVRKPEMPAGARRMKLPAGRWSLLTLGTAMVGVTVLIAILAMLDGRRSKHDRSASTTELNLPVAKTDLPAGQADTPPDQRDSSGIQLVYDDGETLWVSPTHGEPIDLTYVPPTAQCFVHLRPRSMLECAEGSAVLRALGAYGNAIEQTAANLGLSLRDVNEWLLALVPQDVGAPRTTMVLRCDDAKDVEDVASRASDVQELDHGRRFALNGLFVYAPAQDPQLVVVGQAVDVDQIVALRTTPVPLKRQVEKLRRATDSQRHLTVLVEPHFLAADGQEVFSSHFARLRGPLLELLGDHVQAASVSLYFDQMFYGELWLASTLDEDPQSAALAWREKLAVTRDQLKDSITSLQIEDFWQPLAARFPLMIGVLHEQLRIGIEDRSVVINFVLPEHAAHNLVLASMLAAEEASTPIVDSDTSSSGPAVDWPTILSHSMDFEIDQQSLESTMRDLALALNNQIPSARFEIQIAGADLQTDGITRNQQLRDVKMMNQPLAVILTELVRRANPTPVEDPASPAQQLIWVVMPDDRPGDKRVILITTRAGAAKKGYALPPQFLENPLSS